jgi:hypothetical protein
MFCVDIKCSLILWGGNKLQVSEKRLLRKISGLVKNDVSSLGYYVTSDFFVTCTGHLTPSQLIVTHPFSSLYCCYDSETKAVRVGWERQGMRRNIVEKVHLENREGNGRIILRCMLG